MPWNFEHIIRCSLLAVDWVERMYCKRDTIWRLFVAYILCKQEERRLYRAKVAYPIQRFT